jgi:hypothetical protein
MLKLKLTRDKGTLLVFGLSKINIQKLQEGKPINIRLSELGLEGEIYIFAGDTEITMLNELEEAGLIPSSKASTEVKN